MMFNLKKRNNIMATKKPAAAKKTASAKKAMPAIAIMVMPKMTEGSKKEIKGDKGMKEQGKGDMKKDKKMGMC